MPLPALTRALQGLDPAAAFLYAPVDGPRPLREAWMAHQRDAAGGVTVPVGLPFATHGLTHALSLVASLFADPDTDVLLPGPGLGELRSALRAPRRRPRPPLRHPRAGSGGRFSADGLADALAQVRGKAVVVLNFPSNPGGWWPSPEEAAALVEVVTAHPGPLVAVTDDAYQGWVYEPGLQPRSLFWDLAERADPDRHFVVKCDGATKELVFFSSRVGFVTTTATGEAETALLSKLKYLVRGTVGPASGPAMAMTLAALRDPSTPAAFAERLEVLTGRYRTLKDELRRVNPARVSPRPFNSAFFVLLNLNGGLDAEQVRQTLLAEHSVGSIAFPEFNALRLAYCSIHQDRLPDLVDALVAISRWEGSALPVPTRQSVALFPRGWNTAVELLHPAAGDVGVISASCRCRLWPSIACSARRSAPCSSRWVAKLWRST